MDCNVFEREAIKRLIGSSKERLIMAYDIMTKITPYGKIENTFKSDCEFFFKEALAMINKLEEKVSQEI